MKKHLTSIERRRLILGSLAALPFAFQTSSFRYLMSCLEGEAFAESVAESEANFFLEINLRDQWDFGHVLVAPGLASATDPIRGTTGNMLAQFYGINQLKKVGDSNYLTPVSMELEPHLDTIAMVELCELSVGTIHGHEAANAVRSPGRNYRTGQDRLPMWLRDPHAKVGGNEQHYSAVPTPACVHNHLQRTMSPNLVNGYTVKGVGRSIHTVYHFPHRLPLADLSRFQSKEELLSSLETFNGNIIPTADEARLFVDQLKAMDGSSMRRAGIDPSLARQHLARLEGIRGHLYSSSKAQGKIEFSEEEAEYWNSGIPAQRSQQQKMTIGDQVGYACKLFKSGNVRTASVEFDYADIHGQRTKDQMDVMARQTVLPLVRAIETLKATGIYDRTTIFINTLDGGRSPAADSYGTKGKNAVIIAGGGIKGGYYGDIAIEGLEGNGHSYRYFPPTASGASHTSGTLYNDLRVSGASVWRTLMKRMKAPAAFHQYADVRNATPLDYLLS